MSKGKEKKNEVPTEEFVASKEEIESAETVGMEEEIESIVEMSQMAEDDRDEQEEAVRSYQHENIWLVKIGLMIFLTFSCCMLVFFLFYRFKGFADGWNKIMKAAEPLIIGLMLAYLLNPIMKAAEGGFLQLFVPRMKSEQKARRLSRGLGIVVTILFLLIVIGLLLAAVVPALINSISRLADSGSGYMKHFLEIMDKGILGHFEVTEVVAKYLTMIAGYAQNWAETDLLPQVQDYVVIATGGVFSALKALMNFVIGIIVMVYVLIIKEHLVGQSKKLIFSVFKPKSANIIVEITRKADDVFGGFIVGKLIDSAIIGLLCYIGCTLMQIPDTMLVSVIIGVTNIIPVFGPFIGAAPCLLLVVIQSPWHALYLLIFIVVLQQVDGNIIGPKILGNSTGLSSFWVMFAILIGGGLFGFIGMLLGIPIFAMVYYIVSRLVNYSVRNRRLPADTESYVKASGVDAATHSLVYEEVPKKKKRK